MTCQPAFEDLQQFFTRLAGLPRRFQCGRNCFPITPYVNRAFWLLLRLKQIFASNDPRACVLAEAGGTLLEDAIATKTGRCAAAVICG